MASIWSLLAQYGVSIVLNGHDHDYQRWVPLDGNGNPSPTGITEFVAGGGGHRLQTIINSDSRVAYSNDLNPTLLAFCSSSFPQTVPHFSYHSSERFHSGFRLFPVLKALLHQLPQPHCTVTTNRTLHCDCNCDLYTYSDRHRYPHCNAYLAATGSTPPPILPPNTNRYTH